MTSPDRQTPISKEGILIDAGLRAELRRLLGRRVRFDEAMARHSSLRVGGPADALARPQSRTELSRLFALCRKHRVRVYCLGKGFNTLVRDGGLGGLVLQLGEFRSLRREGSQVFAEAGVTHTALARFCAEQGLSGLEFAVGIPGTVGGWLAMNAGIPEREMKDVVARVEYLDPCSGEVAEVPASELDWHYRRLALPAGTVLISARFATEHGDPQKIREEQRRHLDYRRRTQPMNEPSCGSVFKNPPGDRAGRLIEAAGLKGVRAGGAQISELHANFIVTRGEVSAADVLDLIERARADVQRRFGIRLETEVQILGEDGL